MCDWMVNNNLKKLEEITERLSSSIDDPSHPSSIYSSMCTFLDTLKTSICIVRNDKIVLFMNKYLQKRLHKCTGYSPNDFQFKKCIGCSDVGCPIKDKCEGIWNDSKVRVFNNVAAPVTKKNFNVVVIPLKYNCTKAIIEIWDLDDD